MDVITVKHLSKESLAIWKRLGEGFNFGDDHLLLLKVALEAYDRLQEARLQIEKEGSTYKTESGYTRPHPCLQIEKEARAGFLQAWRMLNLDLDPVVKEEF